MNILNSTRSKESLNSSNESSNFIEKTKNAIRKTLIAAWISASPMWPVATTTSTTVIPANINTITAIAPTASATIKTIWLWTAILLFSSFDKEHKSIEINNIKPVDILPIIWQIEYWDKKCYEHIEHLRVAEATRIRDMMWEYGAWDHSPEEYKQLMSRLNTGMTKECPKWYDNYEIIWWKTNSNPDEHARSERSILNTLVNHSNFKVVDPRNTLRYEALTELTNSNPNSINIFGNSVYKFDTNKSDYDTRPDQKSVKDLCNSKNFIIFAAWTNIWTTPEWQLKNKIYNWEYEADEYSRYTLASLANSDKNTEPNSNLMVTIATNAKWDINQTDEIYESTKYPVWFSNNVLFAWRAFPQIRDGEIYWPSRKYTTSDTNYFNVALADLCFQMFAEVKDASELLDMIRSTSLTDYIRLDLNGDGDTDDIVNNQPETQPLHLINPAWFFQKYLMPTALPTNIESNETVDLEKGYYHGVIFQIPGAEVNINGEWIDFSDENKNLILAQNPMTLKWRLNGKLLKKYNYKPWDTINGQILVVDDQWNGLNMTKDFSVSIDNTDGINDIKTNESKTSEKRYSIDGRRLEAKPSKPGIYIMNGEKVIIK